MRLARPDDWARRLLDPVRQVPRPRPGAHRSRHAHRASTWRPARSPCRGADGATVAGALRRAGHLDRRHQRLLAAAESAVRRRDRRRPARRARPPRGGAASVIVIGGGAAAVSSAANLAATWPDKRVDLYFPGERALPQHHPRIWERIRRRLDRAGVVCTPATARSLPDGFAVRRDHRRARRVEHRPAAGDAPTPCCGRSAGCGPTPTGCPPELLDEHGFVRVDAGAAGPRAPRGVRGRRRRGHRSAAQLGPQPRRRAARPQRPRRVRGQAAALRTGHRGRRWGSVLGIQRDGLEVFAPNGRAFRFPAWSFDRVLMPWIVRWGIYRGVGTCSR